MDLNLPVGQCGAKVNRHTQRHREGPHASHHISDHQWRLGEVLVRSCAALVERIGQNKRRWEVRDRYVILIQASYQKCTHIILYRSSSNISTKNVNRRHKTHLAGTATGASVLAPSLAPSFLLALFLFWFFPLPLVLLWTGRWPAVAWIHSITRLCSICNLEKRKVLCRMNA